MGPLTVGRQDAADLIAVAQARVVPAVLVALAGVRVALVVAQAAQARVVPVGQAVAVVAATKEADVDEAKGKMIKITWIRSSIGYPGNQKATIKALGLHRLHETVERADSPQLRGQIFKVKHMLKIEE